MIKAMNNSTLLQLSPKKARRRLRRTIEEYCRLDDHLRLVEDTNFRVCLFGSARIESGDPLYETVFDLCRELAGDGMDVVTGGGPGLMEAANAGVRAARHAYSRSYGLTLDLPDLKEDANLHLDIKTTHNRFSSRLDEFVRLSHAVVVAPGGIGTLLELMYVWQLLQVGVTEKRPIVLLGEEFWRGLFDWMEKVQCRKGFISEADLNDVEIADSVPQVVKRMSYEQREYRRRTAEYSRREEVAA